MDGNGRFPIVEGGLRHGSPAFFRLAKADPGVHPAIEQVDDQVSCNHRAGQHQDDHLNHRQSLEATDMTSRRPTPGHAKTVSMMMAPPMR